MAQSQETKLERTHSISQASENSQTAQEFINSQLRLEAEAREALPYQFDTCTRPLGPLRQSLFSCLTCNPPPTNPSAAYRAAGVCYSCSISCHGEHELVELFNKRNFVCDCGTTRLPSTSPCSLRISEATGTKGNVHSEVPAADNKYNHNFRNNFCICGEVYNAQQQQGTMFQCLGLGTVEAGGCGEDWYHPECIMGISRDWRKHKQDGTTRTNGQIKVEEQQTRETTENLAQTEPQSISNAKSEVELSTNDQTEIQEQVDGAEDDLPPGFPDEEEFEDLVCFKCVDANPWLKRYASSSGFRAALPHRMSVMGDSDAVTLPISKKRKASHDDEDDIEIQDTKKARNENGLIISSTAGDAAQVDATGPAESNAVQPPCKYDALNAAPPESISLFTAEDFRSHICRCAKCYPLVRDFPQLLEEEETYEPPVSEDEDDGGPGSLGSRSLLDRGEAALSNVDRVRAIEGVMVYNHLKDKVKSFLKPFAESGQAVGAEDIKKYFEGLRGDSEAISAAARRANGRDGGDGNGDQRKEQSGY